MEIVNLHDETNGVSRQTYRDIVDIGTILSSAVDRLRRQAQVVKYRKERNLSAKQLEARTLELKKAKEWKNTVKVEANKKDALLHRAMEAEKGIDSLTEAIKLSENELVKALKREEKLQQRVNDLEPSVAKVKLENRSLLKKQKEQTSKMESAEKEHKKELDKLRKRLEKAEMQLKTIHGSRNIKNSELHRKLGMAINQKISAENKLKRAQNALHSSKNEIKIQLGNALRRADEKERVALALESEFNVFRSKTQGELTVLKDRAEAAEKMCDELMVALTRASGSSATLKTRNETAEHELQKFAAIVDVLKQSLAESRARNRSLELTLAEFGIDEKHWTTAKSTIDSKHANRQSPTGTNRTSFGTTLDQMEATLIEAQQFRRAR